MENDEEFSTTQERLRKIWHATEFDQEAWKQTCIRLWEILKKDKAKIEEMLSTN